jgi:hypothetical protein
VGDGIINDDQEDDNIGRRRGAGIIFEEEGDDFLKGTGGKDELDGDLKLTLSRAAGGRMSVSRERKSDRASSDRAIGLISSPFLKGS